MVKPGIVKPVTVTTLSWWKVVGVLVGAALLAVACGSGGTPSGSASPSPTPSVPAQPTSVLCRDAEALRASLDRLTGVSVGAGTVDEVKADLADVKAKLDTLIADAGDQWRAQTSALKSALASLSTAVENLAATPGADALSAVVTALGGVTTAAQNLLAAVNVACPSVPASLSPSPSG